MANKLDHAHYFKNHIFPKFSDAIFRQFSKFDVFFELDILSKCREIDEFDNLSNLSNFANFVKLVIFDDIYLVVKTSFFLFRGNYGT